ncbi:isocitrate lyase/phosphoenolpyruvate mutase family protein [Nocardioides sp. zg-536]|uniref:2-methylisocitrate lyase n=1 Tax=Nocardioides faecalis TaxID=2803858 RepID=A0A938Y6U2_9ACTN|nr:isocitrate lyase/phosphoenolpyruvate mutase family protein [Nocardioides faecalis]MBM9460340.1 isocitrate lyase/phosphoenolpyruvate mutase family protein [Nocardioides faecalis]MBS4751265.1 isocitrate lyase/phosphoenolpyruvate mutase family protein [Nocardioides faecalis]QVI59832.1 isocitrate lyase/phosphoenolpyruvate mutase family protein [Nocardioides faecalis]
MSTKSQLRSRLAQERIVVLPGVADAMTARLAEDAGFEAVYVTGAGFANASFGQPDVGLVTMSEVVEHVRRVSRAVGIPVVVDADTGYGGLLNVHRTVQELEHAGAAAIQLEDQAIPKRCGHFDGQSLVSSAEMVSRIAAAVDARRDPELVLIARTDAYQSEGLEGAVARANAYLAAGADLIFVEAPRSAEDLAVLPSRVHGPVLANMVEGGKTPWRSAEELEELGFRVALFANATLRVAMRAAQEALAVLRETGDTKELWPKMLTWEQRQELIGLSTMQALEQRFVDAATDSHPLKQGQ